jgi:sulfate permease, SulP family
LDWPVSQRSRRLRPLSPEHPDDETFEGLLILRPEGRLFFVNAQEVADQIQVLVAKHRPRIVALDMSRVFDIEYSALQMLIEGERRITEQGVAVWLAGLNPDVLGYVLASGFADHLGRERLFFNIRAALQHRSGGRQADQGFERPQPGNLLR